MAVVRSNPTHSTGSTNLADLLERILDKGVVIAGDVKVSLLDIELLTIQIRLVVCSIDKAQEMGMDWWANSPVFGNEPSKETTETADRTLAALERLESRLETLEQTTQAPTALAAAGPPTSTRAPSAPLSPEALP
ncbi:MAG: gas vesicle protein GvpJ [Planctomycetota bacterium]